VLAAIDLAVDAIADYPISARATVRFDIRVTMSIGYPYKIFYRVHSDLIEIVHVRHASRRPWQGADESS
jgi:plasmid stabilization system protein ParE